MLFSMNRVQERDTDGGGKYFKKEEKETLLWNQPSVNFFDK